MPTYIALLDWTEEGIQKIKESPGRLAAARKVFQDAGAELKDFYMTMGGHDMVAIAEAPDDATMARLLLMVAGQGAVRSETLKAFTEDEYGQIVGSLP